MRLKLEYWGQGDKSEDNPYRLGNEENAAANYPLDGEIRNAASDAGIDGVRVIQRSQLCLMLHIPKGSKKSVRNTFLQHIELKMNSTAERAAAA